MKIINHPGGLVRPRLIAAITAAKEPLSPQDLATLLGISAHAVSSAMRFLVYSKIASVVKKGRHPLYSLAPPAEDNYLPTVPGSRLVRLSDRNMQPANEPLRRFSRGGLACSLGMI